MMIHLFIWSLVVVSYFATFNESSKPYYDEVDRKRNFKIAKYFSLVILVMMYTIYYGGILLGFNPKI